MIRVRGSFYVPIMPISKPDVMNTQLQHMPSTNATNATPSHSRGWTVLGFTLNQSLKKNFLLNLLILCSLFLAQRGVWGQTTIKHIKGNREIQKNAISNANDDLNLSNKEIRIPNEQELWSKESFGKWDMSKELFDKRDQFSKHFLNDHGTLNAHISSGPIHYMENGKWNTIYHSIEPSSNGGFQNVHNSFKTSYPANSSGKLITILPNGEKISDMIDMRMFYEVNGQEAESRFIDASPGKTTFNELSFSEVYGPNIDLRLTQNTSQRKMDYILNNPSSISSAPIGSNYLVFEEKVELPIGWTFQLINNKILVFDSNKNVQLIYEKPVIEEFKKSHDHLLQTTELTENHNHPIEAQYEVSRLEGFLIIRTKVDFLWLSATEREFPIIIDPTATIITTNSNNWTGSIETSTSSSGSKWTSTNVNQDNNGSSCLNSGGLEIGMHTTCCTNYFAEYIYTKYNTSSIPSNVSSVNSVSLSLRHYTSSVSGSSCNVAVHLHQLSSEPVAAASATRLADIRDGNEYATYTYNKANTYDGGDAWDSYSLSATSATDLFNNLPNGWFGIGIESVSSGDDNDYVAFRSHTHANAPYITVDYTECSATTYYSKSTGNLDLTSSWSSTSDGTGCSPANFTTAGVTYIIQQNLASNVSRTIGANWTVSGSGSKVVLGQASSAAVTFTVPNNYTFSGTIDVAAASSGSNTLVLYNTTVPTLGTLNVGSTVKYNASGAQTIQATTYGNLETGVETGSTNYTKTAAGILDINGNLTLGDYSTLALGSYSHTLAGDFIKATGNSILNAGTSTLTFDGSSTQKIHVTVAGGSTPCDADITYYNLVINGSAVNLFYNQQTNRRMNIVDLTVNNGKTLNLFSAPQ
jgi:hypothetical protein